MLCCVLIYYSNFDLNLYLVLLCTILTSLSLYLSLLHCLPLFLCVCVSLYVFLSLSIPPSLSLCLSLPLSVSLSLSLSLCLSLSLSLFFSYRTLGSALYAFPSSTSSFLWTLCQSLTTRKYFPRVRE